MYWSYEGSDFVNLVAAQLGKESDPKVLGFGPNCVADLEALKASVR